MGVRVVIAVSLHLRRADGARAVNTPKRRQGGGDTRCGVGDYERGAHQCQFRGLCFASACGARAMRVSVKNSETLVRAAVVHAHGAQRLQSQGTRL